MSNDSSLMRVSLKLILQIDYHRRLLAPDPEKLDTLSVRALER